MDFYELLSMADDTHQKKSSKPSNFRSTKIEAARKDPKTKRLSDNVKKFLERQKAEELTKRTDAEKQRNELMRLRAGSRESQKTVKRMLTKTKSANHSVMSEAVNERDTADTLAGRRQCDEDDYGYESSMATNLYEKLMNKYESCPDDPMAKFTKCQPKTVRDAASTISRVKEALLKGDEPLPTFNERVKKRSKVKGDYDDFINDGPIVIGESMRRNVSSEDRKERERQQSKLQEENRKKKCQKPPEAKTFEELMKLAQKKHQQPIVSEIKVNNEKEGEFGDRPMTKKEKAEFLRERESKLRRAGKNVTPEKASTSGKMSSLKKGSQQNVNSQSLGANQTGSSKISYVQNTGAAQISEKERTSYNRGHGSDNNSSVQIYPVKDKRLSNKCHSNKSFISSSHLESHHGSASKSSQEKQKTYSSNKVSAKKDDSHLRSSQASVVSGLQSARRVQRGINNVVSRPFPGEKLPPGKAIHSNFKKKSGSRSPLPMSGSSGSSSKSRKMRIESESEHDSEMDDFIDDSEANVDISAEIRNIFGYDKRKYRDEADFDDRSMETNRFSDVMKEECRSARIGKMEDLEDMRREEEEKRLKQQKKKHHR